MKIFLFLLAILTPLHADTNPQEILANYFNNINKIKSLQADIAITVTRDDVQIEIKGQIMHKMDKFYLGCESPYKLVLVSNGREAYLFMNSQRIVYIFSSGQQPEEYRDPLAAQKEINPNLKNMKYLGKRFHRWKNMDVWECPSLSSNKMVSKYVLWFDPKTSFLSRIDIYDMHGKAYLRYDYLRGKMAGGLWFYDKIACFIENKTRILEIDIELKNIILNEPIHDEQFDFMIPNGVKIEDRRIKLSK